MEHDFDFDDELDDLDGFDDDFEGLEDFDDLEELDGEVLMRTAVLSKNNMIALLCVKTADQGGAICRVDPRENSPTVQLYDDPEKAIEWFNKSLRTSRKNGWQIVYEGLPLQG